MNQVLLGACPAYLLALLIYLRQRGRIGMRFLLLTPMGMALGALWAIIPDIPRLLGNMPLYHRLTNDPRSNIFFWHYTIDHTESDSRLYLFLLGAMLFSLLYAAWTELRRREVSHG